MNKLSTINTKSRGANWGRFFFCPRKRAKKEPSPICPNLPTLQRFVIEGYKGGIAVQEVCGTEGKEALVVVVVV